MLGRRLIIIGHFAMAAALCSCGQDGPSKREIADALQAAGQAQVSAANAAMSGVTGTSGAAARMAKFEVLQSDCTAKENGVFHCSVTVRAAGSTMTHDLDLKRVQGTWTVVD